MSKTEINEQVPQPQGSDPEEQEIIARVLAGEREEFRHLVRRYQDMVFALVMRQVGQRTTAEELTQEVFIRAFRSLHTFREEAKFSTWLIRIAINHTNSFFVSKRFKQSQKTEEFNPAVHDMTTSSPESELERKQRAQTLQKALAGLKPNFRDVITLCGLEGKSYDEAAEVLGIPVGTVRSRLNKARLLVKQSFLRLAAEEARP